MRPGAPIYVAHPDTGGFSFRTAFKEAGFYLSSCLIWRKNAFTLWRFDYHWLHEPILYGWKPGAAAPGSGPRQVTPSRRPPFSRWGARVADRAGETTLIVRGETSREPPAR